MNRIQYKAIASHVTSYSEYTTTPIKNPYINYICIYTLTDNFMKYTPPCQTCLIQAMCIKENLAHPTEPDHLYIKLCDRLKQFIYNNNSFYRSWKI